MTHAWRYSFAALALALTLAACSSGGGGGGFAVTNAPPPIAPAASGAPWSLQLQTSGASGPVTFVLQQGPAGLGVDAAGLVTWTPQLADLGTHPVRIDVGDGTTTREVAWSLRVHQDLLLGTAYSPRGFENSTTQQDGIDYLLDRDHGAVIGYHTNWRDSAPASGQVPMLVVSAMAARSQFGVQPTLVLGWAAGDGTPDLTSQTEPANNTWTNAETRQEFHDLMVGLAQQYQPRYLALANELNIWWATHQAEFADWLSLYTQTYDDIKVVSPDTRVYVTFQLEFLKGEGSGWPHGVTWAVFDSMAASGRLDAAAFTSYPYFEHADPAAIPANHYDEITMHWPSGEVIFTEIGWLAAPSGPYPGGTSDQASFVPRFFDLTDDLELEFVQWLFLHDFDGQASFPPFVGIGMRSNDGSVIRPVDAIWQAAVELRER